MTASAVVMRNPPVRSHRWWIGGTALACIGIQIPGSLLLSAVALAVWLVVLALLDRASLRRLWLPRFWIITLIFALGSGLLLGPKGKGAWGILSPEGLQAGLLMVIRGVFIFGLASWASRALGGEDLQRLTRRLHVPRLGMALSVALQLLPDLKDRLQARVRAPADGEPEPERRRRLRRLYGLAGEAICETARLAEELARGEPTSAASSEGAVTAGPRRLVAVVGPPQSGKTTLLGELIRLLEARGISVGGLTQPTIQDGGERTGYRLRDAASGEERELARRRVGWVPGEPGFEFDETAWSWARDRLREARRTRDVVVLDELGRLEARGAGHLASLAEALEGERSGLWLLGVRAECAPAIEERLGPFARTITISRDARPDPGRLVDELAATIAARPDTSHRERGTP